ncbi:MAG TPA: hypothetical protein VLG74_02990 [Blastocatellia bacterium]|nr:hypothetical protein [Blastocatellia bacterium]
MISLRGSRPPFRWSFWLVLLLCAGIPRVVAAFLLPNEEGDPYAYVQAIEMMRASIAGGTFTISELFGFWLPLYQLICALITVVVGHPLYVAKVVSAVCGAGTCLLVFELSEQLTANLILSLFAFALIALNPIHIMYSAFSMSDVPHALMVMAGLYFAIKNRWVIAASFSAVGGLIRPESWLFIVLLPALQFLLHRRVSLTSCFIALSAPLIWIYISWSATGNAFEYFDVRSDYIRELLLSDPGLGSLSPATVIANVQTLLYSMGHAVIIACLIAAWLVTKRVLRQYRFEPSAAQLVTLAYFFSLLGFLLIAFLTKNQPAIFARYCLVLFALGLPVLVWIFLEAGKWRPARSLPLVGALMILCLWQWTVQLRDGASYVNHIAQKRFLADYLREGLKDTSNLKVFCDDDTIKVLAGIPSDSCLRSAGLPRDSKTFLDYLRENRVAFVVYERRNGSTSEKAFRDLGEEDLADHFQLVASTSGDLRLYRTVF